MDIVLVACVRQALEDAIFAIVWSRSNSQYVKQVCRVGRSLVLDKPKALGSGTQSKAEKP